VENLKGAIPIEIVFFISMLATVLTTILNTLDILRLAPHMWSR